NSTVRWTPGENNHPSIRWLSEFWFWICRKYGDSLSQFSDIPLVPVDGNANTQLVKLNINTPVILAESTTATLPPDVCKCLTTLGVIMLQNQPNFIKHTELHTFVGPPTPEGVLSVLGKLSDSAYYNMSKEEKHALCQILANVSEQSVNKNRAILLKLPIFDTLPGSRGKCGQEFVSINEAPVAPSMIARVGINNLRIKKLLIHADDPSSCKLLSILGIDRLKDTSLLSTYIFPEFSCNYYQECEIDQIMVWVLHHLSDLKGESEDFGSIVQELPFVKVNEQNTRVRPIDVFDPQDQKLIDIFRGEDVFPIGPYAERDILSFLEK
ncbi:sacsin-like, partial [Saccoglossus kowalevskii]